MNKPTSRHALASTVIGRWMHENVPDSHINCRVDTLPSLSEAARAGMGLVLLPCYLGDTAPGLHRAVHKTLSEPRTALWLLTHDDLKRTARIRTVMDLLATALAKDRDLLEGKRKAGGSYPKSAG